MTSENLFLMKLGRNAVVALFCFLVGSAMAQDPNMPGSQTPSTPGTMSPAPAPSQPLPTPPNDPVMNIPPATPDTTKVASDTVKSNKAIGQVKIPTESKTDTASANAGNGKPLIYVIDGRLTNEEDLNALDPKNIKRMKVLKDSASIAKYGNGNMRAKGVILVTTRLKR